MAHRARSADQISPPTPVGTPTHSIIKTCQSVVSMSFVGDMTAPMITVATNTVVPTNAGHHSFQMRRSPDSLDPLIRVVPAMLTWIPPYNVNERSGDLQRVARNSVAHLLGIIPCQQPQHPPSTPPASKASLPAKRPSPPSKKACAIAVTRSVNWSRIAHST